MDRVTNAILTLATPTTIRTNSISSNTTITKMMRSIGIRKNSIDREGTSKRNSEQEGMPAISMTRRKKVINGDLMTSTTESIENTSRNSTDSKKSSTNSRKRHMSVRGKGNRVRTRALKRP